MPLLAIRFLAELAGIVALGYAGFTSFAMPWGLVAGIGAALVLGFTWSRLVAPMARNPLPPRVRELLGTALLVLAAGALALAGQPAAGAALAVVVLVDQALIIVLAARVPAFAGDRA